MTAWIGVVILGAACLSLCFRIADLRRWIVRLERDLNDQRRHVFKLEDWQSESACRLKKLEDWRQS